MTSVHCTRARPPFRDSFCTMLNHDINQRENREVFVRLFRCVTYLRYRSFLTALPLLSSTRPSLLLVSNVVCLSSRCQFHVKRSTVCLDTKGIHNFLNKEANSCELNPMETLFLCIWKERYRLRLHLRFQGLEEAMIMICIS